MYLAVKTKEQIDAAIEADQGASFRKLLGQAIVESSDAFRSDNEPFRGHLGASIIGQDCGRKVYYDWHWATREKISARVLRLFNRGHLEEARFIAMLRMIGVEVYQHDSNGKQFRIMDCAGHYSGSGDGIAVGIPDIQPGMPCLLEFKTHNDKSFIKLVKEGVKMAKPEHYVQMNQYMGKFGFGIALYGAVNKNNDDIHWELVPFDRENYEAYMERAHKIVWADRIPTRINNSPSWFQCSWCSHKKICHGLGAVPDKNCRTCAYSQPIDDRNEGGSWVCKLYNNAVIPKEVQFNGCPSYVVNKEL
jgi:hypothetical protein